MTTRITHALTAALLLAIGGCAAFQPAPPAETDALQRLDRGLAALEAGAYQDAFDELTWVYARCAGHERAGQALLALAALELDPRNARARPGTGAELLARAILDPGTSAWARPLAESAYLLAVSLGAPPAAATAADPAAADPAAPAGVPVPVPYPDATATDDGQVHGCGAPVVPGRVPSTLPVLPGPSMAALLAQAEARSDTLSARRTSLEAELTAARARLAETEQELERIRRTLRP